MKNIISFKSFVFFSIFSLGVMPSALLAEDIDIFTGSSGGSEEMPNVMFFLANTPNWSNNGQKIPLIAGGTGTQGAAEVDAISRAIDVIDPTNPMRVGLALGTSTGGLVNSKGAYVRFGARDITIDTNKTGFKSILSKIYAQVTDSSEKLQGQSDLDESSVLYELYKYFNSLTPYAGAYIANANKNNLYADITGNTHTPTAYSEGLRSDFGLIYKNSNQIYNSPKSDCSKQYVIFVANNNSASSVAKGSFQYENSSVSTTNAGATYSDEWAAYLYRNGITVYVIDVYSANPNDIYSLALQNIAKKGGGKYFKVSNQSDLLIDIKTIFNEIHSVSSTFASSSLPVSTTNRAQEKNQVFIPMFRPDPNAYPRWMGNMKQYQLITAGTSIVLGDNTKPNPIEALNYGTGLPTDCAISFWTTPSSSYWENVTETPVPSGECSSVGVNPWSDSPDGPFVEKGGVAEVIRKGNAPSTTNTSPTWNVNRTIYTQPLAGGAFSSFSSSSTGLSTATSLSSSTTPTLENLTKFIKGQDILGEYTSTTYPDTLTTPTAPTRPSLHGDTIHSRPLPIDYDGTNVVVYYGSNDGTYRAIDATDGHEIWSFIAPEHYSKLPRLYTNSPLINYPGMPAVTPAATSKGYFFDGSTGVYQNIDNSKIWIYPSMRRGGRMLYAFNVTNRTSPAFMWKVGCPNNLPATRVTDGTVTPDDTGCSSGMSGIGQTWSTPQVAEHISGYDKPVVIIGGGYDNCEDQDVASPSCSTRKGAVVYVLDAETGALIKTLSLPGDTPGSVAADIALLSHTTTGIVDYAYVTDTHGNIYRINFNSADITNSVIHRIAYTNGSNRKFFYPPALLTVGNTIYLAIGTGDREHPLYSQYPFDEVTNRLYVFADNLSDSIENEYNLDNTTIMSDKTTDNHCASESIIGTNFKGWFMDLNQYGQGEQTVTSALITSGLIVFSTNRPIAPEAGSCTTSLGEARGYWVNVFNGSGAVGTTNICGGTRSGKFVGGGLPPSPIFAVVPIDGIPTTVVIGAVQREGVDGGNGDNVGSSPIAPQEVLPNTNLKRNTVYWKSSGNN
nr:PilC/PilY family type IV pilus protein [uncultured Tolumonas sp.]